MLMYNPHEHKSRTNPKLSNGSSEVLEEPLQDILKKHILVMEVTEKHTERCIHMLYVSVVLLEAVLTPLARISATPAAF